MFRTCALGIAVLAVAPVWAASDLEFQVKAAFLHNFAKFVEWPAAAAERAEFCVALMGPDPFGETIDGMAKGRTVNGKPVVVRRITRASEARFCQILFVNFHDRERVGEILKSLPGSVLTIGQSEDFLEAGGMINFIIEDQKVRFEMNADAARRAGLRIHAQLLKLARPAR